MNNQLQIFSKKFLDIKAKQNPSWATLAGYEGYDDLLPDPSSEAREQIIYEQKSLLSQLEKLNPEGLNEQIDSELLRRLIATNLFCLEELKFFQSNPADIINQVSDCLWSLMMSDRFSDKERVSHILKRLGDVPLYLKNAVLQLKKVVSLWKQLACEEVRGLQSYLKEDITSYLNSQNFLKQNGIIEEVLKALKEFCSTVEAMSATESHFGVGREAFEYLVKNFHGLDLNASQIKEIGLLEVTRIQEKLMDEAKKMDPKKTWQEIIDELKRETPEEEDLLNIYQKEVGALKKFIQVNQIVTLPSHESLRTISTPPFLLHSIPYAAYSGPAMFGNDSWGNLFVSPIKGRKELLAEHCKAAYPLTALHETYPGHHLQFSIQRKIKSPIRKIYHTSTYYEGWTLYCEEMMYHAGFLKTKGMRLFQLKDRLWRAHRVVVDVAMHCEQMSDKKAVDYLVASAKLSQEGARADVNWYTQSPTIPMSYLIGALEVEKLKNDYLKKEKTLKEFHDDFLSCGAIPLPLVRRLLFSSFP